MLMVLMYACYQIQQLSWNGKIVHLFCFLEAPLSVNRFFVESCHPTRQLWSALPPVT